MYIHATFLDVVDIIQ